MTASESTAVADERIYVGGLDPSRGLTVELVASRLCSVKGVRVLSINDTPIVNDGEPSASSNSRAIYTAKRKIVDEDGDVVDNQKFFYLRASASSGSESSGSVSVSALELLAKQYNNTKWKGCLLRVEAAKPHFLERLEQEREQRRTDELNKHARLRDAPSTEMDSEDAAAARNKTRRRLRIRQRFGEEAYNVDTHPQTIQMSSGGVGGGWKEFGSLHRRLSGKRDKQRKKLMELRRDERRRWASGGGGARNPMPKESDDLRSLIFLNRSIHIRFSDDDALDEDGGRSVQSSDGEVYGRFDEEQASSTASVQTSDSSLEERGELDQSDKAEDYAWSDDESEGSGQSSTSEERGSGMGNVETKYQWSDEDSGSSNGSSDGRNCKQHQSDEELIEQKKGHKKMVDGSAYTKAAAVDEFSGGMDFDEMSDELGSRDSLSDDEEQGFPTEEEVDLDMESDIKCNIHILSKLLGEELEERPRAQSIDGVNGEDVRADQPKNLSSVFGGGIIALRYDPTKDESTEVPMKPEPEEDNDADDGESSDSASESPEIEQRQNKPDMENPLQEKPLIDGKVVPDKDVYEQEKLDEVFKQAKDSSQPFSFSNLFEKDSSAGEAKDVAPVGDIYEQDRLEQVFKKARDERPENGEGGFSFGFTAPPAQEEAPSFSFGFEVGEAKQSPDDELPPTIPTVPEQEVSRVDEPPTQDEKKNVTGQRNRRTGMLLFAEGELDRYEKLFFGLNEGERIISDLEGMRNDEASQEQWQNERQTLTADWKRKQKSASQKKTKKFRR